MAEFTASEKEIVARMMSKSDDELLAQLGRAVAGDTRGAFPTPFAKLVEDGKTWLAEHQNNICKQVCSSESVVSLADDNDRAHLALTISSIVGHAIPPVTVVCVAILLSRIGVRELCKSYWTPAPGHGRP